MFLWRVATCAFVEKIPSIDTKLCSVIHYMIANCLHYCEGHQSRM
jgi:hypothetical protein